MILLVVAQGQEFLFKHTQGQNMNFAWVRLLFKGSGDVGEALARGEARITRAAKAAVSAGLVKVLSVGLVIISTPLTIGYLGTTRFGIWMTILSISPLLVFADLGVGSALINEVARSEAADDNESARRLIANSLVAMTAVGAILLLVLVTIASVVDLRWTFGFTTADWEVRWALLVEIVACSLSIPLGIIARVFNGIQLGYRANGWQALASVISLVVLVIVARHRLGLPALVFAIMGVPVVVCGVSYYDLFFNIRPDLSPSWKSLDWSTMRRLFKAGLVFFVLQVAGSVAFASDSLVVSASLGPSCVAEYAVATRLFSFATAGPQLLVSGLWPAFSEAYARGDRHWLRSTMQKSLVITAVVAALGSIVVYALAKPLAAAFSWHEVIPSVSLLRALAVWSVLASLGGTIGLYLNGIGKIRLQAICTVAMSVVAISLKLILVHLWGTGGVVWATVIAYSLVSVAPLSSAVITSFRTSSN